MSWTRNVTFGLVFAACGVFAQTPATLVRLNVAAVDSNGEPVLDLKASDFQIADQGKAQKIAFFQLNGASMAPGPKEFSNRAGKPPHTTVILFDLLNEVQSDQLATWHLLGKSLQQLESGEGLYFYVLTMEGNLQAIHGISKGADDDKTWTQSFEKTLDKAMKGDIHARPAQMNDNEMVVKKTYVALETLANQMLQFPGRRDIIWVTSNMPYVWNPKLPCNGDNVDCALYVPHLAVTLATANVAVNPATYTVNPNANMAREAEEFAGMNGGWAYTGQDIRAVLKEVTRDATHNYSIAYETPADSWDSKFHKVRVTCERKGLKIRTRQRYYAFPDTRDRNQRNLLVLKAAFQGVGDDRSIGLRAMLAPGADPKAVKVQFRIDPSSLMLTESAGSYTGSVTYLVADMGASGPMGDPMISTLPISLTKDQYASALKEGIPLSQDHALNDAVQGLRIIVLDPNLNVAGSLTIPAR
ncbi:MAG TPA: VWA domain-containing protein [Bryobacteraceae bacterium]|nr:VWA domain-containing protein [Bryobacteraceae bacterium]